MSSALSLLVRQLLEFVAPGNEIEWSGFRKN
eukprot:CAMPEP_0179454830 /NCGR_PEP_ID=MMETSP0799-20121207/38795_1 /TAXON_ID=46947 /ORGANISM="Geminigera cryophila, Strain CCMP2564" /LENGTH=30 /DNA_ID= /DNA_START= /DNA_END= /DNA_ORIENTATION=